MELQFAEAGSAAGRPLFFLHGLFGNANNWAGAATAMARRGFHCISPDQRNHGRSPHADKMDYPSMARDLLDLADRQGFERFSVVGHSMGGKTAMEAALAAPERILALVVVDIAPIRYEPLYMDFLRALQALDLRTVTKRPEADIALKGEIPEAGIRNFLLTNLVRGKSGAYQWRINLEGISANYADIWGALEPGRTFHGPALFIKGSNSDYIAQSHYEAMKSMFPAFRCQTIANAGHWVPTDQPLAFIMALSEFLV